jgi:hypothetical protein
MSALNGYEWDPLLHTWKKAKYVDVDLDPRFKIQKSPFDFIDNTETPNYLLSPNGDIQY